MAGIVHIGLGAFHRAHQAVYTHDAMAASGGDWGIVAVAPSSRTVLDALAAQRYGYHVVTLSPGATDARLVTAHREGLHAASDPDAVIRRLADPAIKIVTLTVTEKAYRRETPIMQLLAAGLAKRGGAPITLLSCDNLPGNGQVLAGVLGEIDGVEFPSCMVDRIVPATPRSIVELYGDPAAVVAEPFSQWVIEDRFAAGRPDWEAAGVQFTDDVAPWEHLKLRVLNGLHSALAYLGALSGCDTIAETLQLPGMRDMLRWYVETEVTASFTPPSGVDILEYADSVLTRFSNAELGHRTLQVAMDGTQKLPQRLLSVLNTAPDPVLSTLIAAAWAQFAASDAPLDDPLAERVRADLHTEKLFGEDGVLPVPDAARRMMIEAWRQEIGRRGAAAVVRQE